MHLCGKVSADLVEIDRGGGRANQTRGFRNENQICVKKSKPLILYVKADVFV